MYWPSVPLCVPFSCTELQYLQVSQGEHRSGWERLHIPAEEPHKNTQIRQPYIGGWGGIMLGWDDVVVGGGGGCLGQSLEVKIQQCRCQYMWGLGKGGRRGGRRSLYCTVVMSNNGSPPCHSDWSIIGNFCKRNWETSSQPIRTFCRRCKSKHLVILFGCHIQDIWG